MEVEATVSNEAVLEQEMKQDNTDSESYMSVVVCLQMLSPSMDEMSVSVGVRNRGSKEREPRRRL